MLVRSIRRTSILLTVLMLVMGGSISVQSAPDIAHPVRAPGVKDSDFRASPVMFIENAGQWPDAARFQVWGGTSGTMWLAEDAIWITVIEQSPDAGPQADGLRGRDPVAFDLQPSNLQPSNTQPADPQPVRAANIKLSFVGANPHPRIVPFDRLDTVVSYFIGNDADEWRPDVPVWGGVRYVDLYPGVDLESTSEGGQMVQRLVAPPGADLSMVRLRVEGADTVVVDEDILRLDTVAGEVVWPMLQADWLQAESLKGAVSQVLPRDGQSYGVTSPFALTEGTPELAPTDPQSMTDNPAELRYGTFLGGSGDDGGHGVAVDGSGTTYVTGRTGSDDFPTTPGAFDRSLGSSEDVFVVKLNPLGSGLTYATFLGGSGSDFGASITVGESGTVYATGATDSADFPTTPGAFDRSFGGGICGTPPVFPCSDVFVIRLNPAGSGLAYATYLGGSGYELSRGIAANGSEAVYITGYTGSTDFPTTPGAYDRGYGGGDQDAFVAKINPAGSALDYATFLGGRGYDYGYGIAADSSGAAYVAGSTTSADFPTTPGAFDRNHGGGTCGTSPNIYPCNDGFVIRLNPTGSGLTLSTFLGGSGIDAGSSIAVDGGGAVYVTGVTSSADFPTTPGAYDRSYDGGRDAFVAELNPAGSALTFATFLGGSSDELGYSIAIDGRGAAYVMGVSSSNDFPTTPGAFGSSWAGDWDDFVAKVNPTGSDLAYATFLGGSGYDYGFGIATDESGAAYVTGQTTSADFPTTPGAFDRSYNGGGPSFGDAFVVKLAMGVPPDDTIIGRVTDANGHGIPGVTVWAGFPLNTTTDANGNYTFMGLSAGTYTITPDKAPCTFAPSTQTVTIPPGQALPDFTSVRLASGLDACILEPGDILLKAGAPVGDYTDLIRFWIKLGGSYFTHSALYLGVTSDPQNPAQTGPRIAEAAGKKKLGGSRDDEVWETWLEDTQWWDGENVTDWAVVRPMGGSEAKGIAIQYARGKAANPNVVFDFLANLADEQKFYCSKLVWKSYQQAGLDVHKKTGLAGSLTSYWVTPEDLYFGSPVVQNMPGVDPATRAFFRVYSPAHITLIDPAGRRTGFDSSSGGEINEIPGALYSGTDAEIESVTVAGLGNAQGWRVLATGYESGTYTLETGYLDVRTRNWETHTTTSEGTVDEYPVRPPNYMSYLPLVLR